MIFIITGCKAEYTLTFENDVFSEHIVITEEKFDGNTSDLFGITKLKDNPKLAQIDDTHSYKYKITSDKNNNILTLDFEYKDISIDKSLVYNNCFRYKNFINGKDYYYVKLEGDMSCEYLTDANIVFKTDKKVFMENADEKDEENGIYKWNNFTGGEIYFQVSKSVSIADANKNKNQEFIPWYVKIIISLIVIVIVFVIYKKIKRDQE